MDVSSLLKDKCGKEISNCTNEEIYYNLNIINEAMEKNNKITFNYSDKQFKNKHVCLINPMNMINNHENYYLLTVNDLGEEVSFNVDKMTNIKILQWKIYIWSSRL